MRQPSLMLAGLCAVVAAAHSVHAQAIPDTTASFHEGEWGMGFILRNNFTSAGVLRFSTPTRAWVLDGSASVDRQSQSSSMNPEATARSFSLAAELGPRWYHAMSGHATSFLGFGGSSGYARSDYSGTSSHNMLWSVGAYGEAGMQYMITRYLGLGWRGTISASRVETRTRDFVPQGFFVTSEATGYHVGIDAVQLSGTIYF